MSYLEELRNEVSRWQDCLCDDMSDEDFRYCTEGLRQAESALDSFLEKMAEYQRDFGPCDF